MYRPRNPFDGEVISVRKEDNLEPVITFQKSLKLSLSTLKLSDTAPDFNFSTSIDSAATLSGSRNSITKVSKTDLGDADLLKLQQLRHRKEVIDNEMQQIKQILELKQQSLARTMLK